MTHDEIKNYVKNCPYSDKSIDTMHTCDLEFHYRKICPSPECFCADKFGLKRKEDHEPNTQEVKIHMTYQEAKWIVKEVERLISAYKRNTSLGDKTYYEVIPNNIYPSNLLKMQIEEVADIINTHYGVYKVNDIVIDKDGCVGMITFVEANGAETIHDIKYHTIQPGGMTEIISIDKIEKKLGSYDSALGKVDEILNVYFEEEMERISKSGNK